MTREANNPEFFHADGTVNSAKTHKRFWQFRNAEGQVERTMFVVEATARKHAKKTGFSVQGFIRKP